MLPIKHSTIFKSRWWALLWAAGIIWMAMDIAAPPSVDANGDDNQLTGLTDATGQPVTRNEEEAIANLLNG